MDTKLVNCFINSTQKVMKSMAAVECTPGKPKLKGATRTTGILTGIVGIASDRSNGCFVLSFDAACLLSIVNRMRAEQYIDINPDVIDAVGELAHLISSDARGELAKHGYEVFLAAPVIASGQNVDLKLLSKVPVTTIPFEASSGRFVVELALS